MDTKVGIVQPIVGSIGGNDAVLKKLISVLKEDGHHIILYTFSGGIDIPYVTVHSKIPKRMPFLGLYQKWFMPKFDGTECDVYFSLTGTDIKTDKLLFIYDQNNLSFEFDRIVPVKYKSGFWKVYYYPYKMFNKPKVNKNAQYISNSNYCSNMLQKVISKNVDVIYPGIELSSFHTAQKKSQICMVGRISPEKNLEFAVEVLNRTPYPSFIFGNVTKSNKQYFNKLQSIAEPHVRFMRGDRNQLRQLLSISKVYFSTSEETFGISTVESMASGCIPIVPNNTAHSETVPIDELRYTPNDMDSATTKLRNALNGNFDCRLDGLYKHIQNFDVEKFNEKVRGLLNIP